MLIAIVGGSVITFKGNKVSGFLFSYCVIIVWKTSVNKTTTETIFGYFVSNYESSLLSLSRRSILDILIITFRHALCQGVPHIFHHVQLNFYIINPSFSYEILLFICQKVNDVWSNIYILSDYPRFSPRQNNSAYEKRIQWIYHCIYLLFLSLLRKV